MKTEILIIGEWPMWRAYTVNMLSTFFKIAKLKRKILMGKEKIGSIQL